MKQCCDTGLLYSEQRERLLSLINSHIRDKAESDDILHDTFVKFEECCQKGCECDYPKAYLFRMALNTVSDFFKKRKKERKLEECTDQPTEVLEEYSEFPCDIYHCIYKFLNALSPSNREAFIQSDIENVPQKQIAESLNIPISTLKSRVQRTRTYLKMEFEACLKKY